MDVQKVERGALRGWANDTMTSFGFMTIVGAVLVVVALATGRFFLALIALAIAVVSGGFKLSQGAAARKADELERH